MYKWLEKSRIGNKTKKNNSPVQLLKRATIRFCTLFLKLPKQADISGGTQENSGQHSNHRATDVAGTHLHIFLSSVAFINKANIVVFRERHMLWRFSALSSQLQLTFSSLLFVHFLHLITSGFFSNWEGLLLPEVLLQMSLFCKYYEGTRFQYSVYCK